MADLQDFKMNDDNIVSIAGSRLTLLPNKGETKAVNESAEKSRTSGTYAMLRGDPCLSFLGPITDCSWRISRCVVLLHTL